MLRVMSIVHSINRLLCPKQQVQSLPWSLGLDEVVSVGFQVVDELLEHVSAVRGRGGVSGPGFGRVRGSVSVAIEGLFAFWEYCLCGAGNASRGSKGRFLRLHQLFKRLFQFLLFIRKSKIPRTPRIIDSR